MKIHRFLQGSAIDLAQAFRNVLRQKRRVAFALAIVMGGCNNRCCPPHKTVRACVEINAVRTFQSKVG